MDALAVDWSGAASTAAQRRTIWVAEASDGVLVGLAGGFTRDEATAAVLGRLRPGMIVGLDFSFSFPAWFVRAIGAADGPGVWDVAAGRGADWLSACDPPFWGRPGRPRPAANEARSEWRRTECGPARPKSTFQIGGAGSVGTGAVRGMPHLRVLRAAGVAVWPFDAVQGLRAPVVAEVYPRWATGPVVKSRAAARAVHVAQLGTAVPRRLASVAAGSEDAFDAACTAVALSHGGWEFPATDELDLVEGRILPLVAPAFGRAIAIA